MSVILQPIELNEKSKSAELIAQLEKVPLGRMYQASFKAVVRLHLFFTGRTHELFLQFTKEAKAIVMDQAGKNQILDGSSGFAAQIEVLKAWGDMFNVWRGELEAVRIEAASIPFGVMAMVQERMIVPNVQTFKRSNVEESVQDGVFSPQLNILLNAAGNHLYGDGLTLSARVWQIDREARDGINKVLMAGIANGDSAWNIAQQLEQYLGANADCPRWTSTRLYGRTKSDIATGDTTGLLRGDQCTGAGVSYNALRLARTEIQKAHALATDKMLASQPWVKQEQVHLSAAHPETDICDETVQGGANGEGIYDVGTVELPLHPNCLCYKTAVLMPEAEFTASLKGWMDGSKPWAEMDAYEQMLGGQGLGVNILPNAINLAVWLFGDNLEKWIK